MSNQEKFALCELAAEYALALRDKHHAMRVRQGAQTKHEAAQERVVDLEKRLRRLAEQLGELDADQ